MKFSITIIIFFLSINAYSSTVYSIRSGSKTSSVKTTDFFGVDHFTHDQVAKYLLRKAKHSTKDHNFQFSQNVIHYLPGSFFISYENWSGKEVAQLNLPVRKIRNKFYFPSESFLKALDTLDVYTVSFSADKKHIVLASNEDVFSFRDLPKFPKFEMAQKSKLKIVGEQRSYGNTLSYTSSNPFIKSFKSLNKELSSSIKDLKPEKLMLPLKTPAQEVKEDIQSSNPKMKKGLEKKEKSQEYLIPKGLIRRELQELEEGMIEETEMEEEEKENK